MTHPLYFDSTVETIDVCGTQQVAVCLPDDWKGEQVTVVRGVATEGLTPAGDGTYYGLGSGVPGGWHWRHRPDTDWFDVPVYSAHRQRFVQCRPAPEPRTERVPWYDAVAQQLSVPTPGGPVEVNGCRMRDGAVTLTRAGRDVVEVDSDGTVEVLTDPRHDGVCTEPRPTSPTDTGDPT